MKSSKSQVEILGIPFSPRSKQETYEVLHELIQKKHHVRIFTPNPEMLYKACQDASLRKNLLLADLLLPDGVGVILASKIKGTLLPERITGIDTGEWLLRYAASHSLSVFLLGGKDGVADRARKALLSRIPDLNICGTHHGYFNLQTNSTENQRVLQKIQVAHPDFLFVCLGSPRQEQWIAENTEEIPQLRLSIGLGGALDIWSGNVKRAPKLIQDSGTEWLWRTLQEPKRIGRLRYLPLFLWKTILDSQNKIGRS